MEDSRSALAPRKELGMATDVNAIKDQFARFLDAKDSATSKTMAEYYLKNRGHSQNQRHRCAKER